MKLQLLVLAICIFQSGIAQQFNSFEQYRINNFALNPAVAGFRDCNTLNFGYRAQWLGFEGAPTTAFLTLHTRLNKARISQKNVQGAGLYFAQEEEGIQQTTYLKFAYSYHFALSKNYEASVGMYLGVQKKSYDNINLQTPAGMVDPAFEDRRAHYIFPDISPGIYIKGSRLFTGLSIMQIYPTKYRKMGTSASNLSPHFYLMGGYDLGKYSWKFTPSFLLSVVPNAPPTLDMSFSADYRNKLLFAIGGKYANSVYFSMHLHLMKWLKVAYTYSFPISQLQAVSTSSQSLTFSISGCDAFVARPAFYCPAFR